MAKDYSRKIQTVIDNFLRDDDWNYSFHEENGVFEFGLSLRGVIKSVKYIVDVWENDFMVYAVCPFGVDQDNPFQISNMSMYLTMVNYGLRNGNFELDVRDGEIRYKCFVECKNMVLSPEAVEVNISIPAMMYDRYGRGIVNILVNDATAEEAISLCEDRHYGGRRLEERDLMEEPDDSDIPPQ